MENYVSIPDFYAGKSIFVTGGSGFLGKVFIEKLLYSCPLLEKIYVLLRGKKNLNAEQRLKNMIEQPVFSRLKAERSECLKKIVLVEGELTGINLNISDEDLRTIREKVSVVIHSAATVKFNESLKIALAINVEGTRNIINLCHSIKNIEAFVYVSTAYSNSNRNVIEEELYPPPASIEEAYQLMKEEDGKDEDIIKFLNGMPNTYTYTKALAENLVSDIHGDLPTVIIRPSIVTSAKEDPVPGWVDNWYGSSGLMTPLAMGICRTMYAQYDNLLDMIPVDYVCNLILVAATRAQRSQLAIYNSCSSSVNPLSIGDAISTYTKVVKADGAHILPCPELVIYTQRKWLIQIIITLMYLIAYVYDILLVVARKKPRFHKILAQSVMVQELLFFFTSHSWLIKSPKALALAKSLSPQDYRRFPCNPQDINWEEYIPVYYQGVKKYLIKRTK